MRKILLIDPNTAFTSDVESRLILDSIPDTDIVIGMNYDNISEDIAREQPTELLISARVIPIRSDWDLGIPVKCYAKSSEDIALANSKGVPCYGIMNTAKELLRAVELGTLVQVETRPNNSAPQPQAPQPQVTQPSPQPQPTMPVSPVVETPSIPVQSQTTQPEVDLFATANTPSINKAMYTQPQTTPNTNQNPTPSPTPSVISPVQAMPTTESTVQNPFAQQQTVDSYDIRAKLAEAKRKEEEEAWARGAAIRKQKELDAAYAVERDMGNVKPPARVVTVYSAKGGVGKTTISCELATFLALTSHGRGKFRVCIADFNIDFGDVLNTLSYNPDRSCMTYWAADIQSKLESGLKPEQIIYTDSQISVYLQQNEKDGLYALIAPLTNEDSMDITDQQIEIMMNNLVKYGGFDFVICDTGNNTRDSSIISLEKADEVLLVMTQDVNTANCNNGFLSTMHKIGFDMNKFRLVINKTRPAKTVAISTDELTEAFINPMTGQPYPCLAKIKDDNEVKHANNLGEPLVYNSGHEFTKSIGVIAKEIIGDNFVLGEPEKKSFFGKLFGSKKSKK